MAPAKQLLGSKPVSARHLRHRCFARKRLRDDLRLDLGRPASPPARPCNHLDPTDVPSVRVKRMVKPIPMKESGPSRITIAHAMWGRNYAYDPCDVDHTAECGKGAMCELGHIDGLPLSRSLSRCLPTKRRLEGVHAKTDQDCNRHNND